jgi:hypothetical protein
MNKDKGFLTQIQDHLSEMIFIHIAIKDAIGKVDGNILPEGMSYEEKKAIMDELAEIEEAHTEEELAKSRRNFDAESISESCSGVDEIYPEGTLLCGRCYNVEPELFPPKCKEKPEDFVNQPIGMYHCPDCGAMVVGGVPHPHLCKLCVNLNHPDYD